MTVVMAIAAKCSVIRLEELQSIETRESPFAAKADEAKFRAHSAPEHNDMHTGRNICHLGGSLRGPIDQSDGVGGDGADSERISGDGRNKAGGES